MAATTKDRPTASTLTRWSLTPMVLAFLGSSRLRDRPDRMLGLLHRADPRHLSPFGFWLLSAHVDIEAVLRDPRFGTDERELDLSLLNLGPLDRVAGGHADLSGGAFVEVAHDLMLFRNPPDHTRLRGLVSRAFTPRRVASIEGRIEAVADELVESIAGQGRNGVAVDLMAELAYPYPARVICELLGLPPGDHGFIARHGRALAAGLDPLPTPGGIEGANEAVVALRAHLEPVLVARRSDPRDDLLSDLVHAADDEDRLSTDELVATVILLLVAGFETTANLIGNGTVLLDRDPVQRARLQHGLADAANTVEELLRRDPPVGATMRIAREDVELGGRRVPAGSAVILLLLAGNHDPAVFPEPNRLDLERPNAARHLTFGAGAHYCLGAALARMEGRIMLAKLARTFPRLRVVDRPRPRHRPTVTIRGYDRLPVVLDGRSERACLEG